MCTPEAAPDLRVPVREIALDAERGRAAGSGLRHHRPLHRSRRDHRRRAGPSAPAHRLGQGARRRRSLRRAPDQAGRQRQCQRQAPGARLPAGARAAARARRETGHAIRVRARGHHHQGDDLHRRARESRPQGAARARGSGARRRRELRRIGAAVRDAGIRALGSRARPRHHSLQHQPCRARADDHRPQLPHQDQRQYRQLGGDLVGRGRGREDGVGDPLGRRHRDGPLHRPQHPQHPRMDHPQLAGADRHRADLPGAGEGRRRSGEARLGVLQGHAHRAVRAGRRLFHHPCRRAARLRAADRQPRHRHCLARRLDHGQVVPVPPQGKLPLRALRGDLRHHAQIRRVVLARRRPASRLDRRRQRPRAVRRAGNAGRAHADRLEEGLPGDDRRPRPRAAAQDQDQHGQAAQGVRRGAVLHARARSPPTSRPATTTSPRASAPP